MYNENDNNKFISSINSENNEFQKNIMKNNKENNKFLNKIGDFSSKSDEKLSDLNTSSGNNDNDNLEDSIQEKIEKDIENLLDSSEDDDIINNNDGNEIEIDNNYHLNELNYCNQRSNNETNFNYNCNMDPVLLYISAENNYKQQLYNKMMMSSIYQNFNYKNNNNQCLVGQNMNNINSNLIPNNHYFQQNNPINQSYSTIAWYNNNNSNNNNNSLNKQKKSIDKKYIINLMDIKTNKEKRTTIRMMNIPSYFRPLDLAKKIDEKFGISSKKENRIYDFIYIPFRENKKTENIKNAGYAFINFVHPKHILKFYSFFNGKHLKLKTSEKVCIITFASRQGTNVKYKGFEQSINDKYMYFSDTKNHEELLTD